MEMDSGRLAGSRCSGSAPRRFNTTLISSFAGIALLLAVLGIYSVMAFSVALRTQEVAIRVALGSQRSGIYCLTLSSGLQLAAIGAAVGLIGVYAMVGLMKSFLFEVHVLDALIIIASVLAIFPLCGAGVSSVLARKGRKIRVFGL
jgi:putative ABC transport system permease protein